MRKSKKYIAIAAIASAISTTPAHAKRHYHHHASFYVSHPHYAHHAHYRTFAHHAAHYAVSYGVHYEIRRAVRAALSPVDGQARPETSPRHVAAVPLSRSPAAPAEIARSDGSVARTEYAHAGPRIGVDLAPGEMRVAAVTPESPAYLAGIDPGDVIVAANGNTIKSADDFAAAISAAVPSGALKMTVMRDGRQFNATIALTQNSNP